jgi:hypothetical protein
MAFHRNDTTLLRKYALFSGPELITVRAYRAFGKPLRARRNWADDRASSWPSMNTRRARPMISASASAAASSTEQSAP